MKKTLLLALLRLGIEKGMQNKANPKILTLKIVAGILMFLGGIFLLITCHQLLAFYYNHIVANLVFAITFVIISIVTFIIANKKKNQKKLTSSEPFSDLQDMAQPFINSAQYAGEKVRTSINHHQGKVIVGVLLAGVLYGRYQANKVIKSHQNR